jgi:hypothetical protein
MEWVAAESMSTRSVMRLAKTDLVEVLSAIVIQQCVDLLPSRRVGDVAPAIKSGIVSACRYLLNDPKDMRDETLWRVLFALPPYWEPPVARFEPPWPKHQLQAYRWTTAIVAYSVRNALEDLHTEHIPDSLMPALNRAVRDAIYTRMLQVPSLDWRLGRLPRALIESIAQAGQVIPLPAVVG